MATPTVLVTGGTGYVGTVLVPLLAQRYQVKSLDTEHFGNTIANTQNVEFIKADILDLDALRKAMKEVRCVIHLAGIVTDELVAMNPLKAMRINLLGTENVLRTAAEAGVERFIYASSSSVYGSGIIPCEETTPPHPLSIYAMTKLLGEELVEEWRNRMECVIVRCATCCGPAPRMRLDTVVNIFSAQAYFQKKITVQGGNQRRTNIHVKDAAGFYSLLIDFPKGTFTHTNGVYNLTCRNHSVSEIANQVARLVSVDITITTDKTQRDARSYQMNGNRAYVELAWKPRHTIEDAILDNFAWFKAGHIEDWQDSLYYNTKRMEGLMHE